MNKILKNYLGMNLSQLLYLKKENNVNSLSQLMIKHNKNNAPSLKSLPSYFNQESTLAIHYPDN